MEGDFWRCTGEMVSMAFKCPHGREARRVFGCGRCEGCRSKWRLRALKSLLAGVEEGPAFREMRFVTMTLPGRGRRDVDEMVKRWRGWTKEFEGRWWRVFEGHKKGGVHVHWVTDARLTAVHGAKGTKKAWKAGLSEKQREWVRRVTDAGFGEMTAVERPTGSGRALAGYLTTYLVKGGADKALMRRDGRMVRRYGYSRDWKLKREGEHHDGRLGASWRVDGSRTVEPECCLDGANAMAGWAQDEGRMAKWWKTKPDWDVLGNWVEARAARQRAYNKRQDYLRRTGDVVHNDWEWRALEAEIEGRKEEYDAAVGRLRSAGYDGPLRLLVPKIP